MLFKEYLQTRNINNTLHSISNKEADILNIYRSKSGWLNEYSNVHLDNDLLLILCKSVLSSNSIKTGVKDNIRSMLINMNSEYQPQFLYLMKNDLGVYKIGISNNPEKRAKALSNASGLNVDVVSYWRITGKADQVERFIHDKFKSERLIGEWFKFNYEFTCKDIERLIPCKYERLFGD